MSTCRSFLCWWKVLHHISVTMLSSWWQTTCAVLLHFVLLNRGDCEQFYMQPDLPQRIAIPFNETSSIYLQDIPPGTTFAVIQIHTQRYNLSLSSEPAFKKSATKNGTDVGLTTLLDQGKTQFVWYVRASHNLTAVAYVQLYTPNDPLPGGCNQVFSLAIDPSIEVNVRSHSTHVWFQWSNLASPQGQPLPDCENINVTTTLSYDVYVAFVQQRDFSEESYFRSIEGMLSPDGISNNGVNVFSLSDSPTSKSQVTVTSETNQGALYAVVVTRSDNNRRAAYITSVTYGCDIEMGDCSSESSVLEIVFAAVLCICGLFLLIAGHSYFKIMLFLFGLTFTSLLAYILLSLDNGLNFTTKLSVSIAVGAVGGCIWVVYWYFCAFPIISVMVPGMCAGYLIASTLFFTPFANIWWWDTSVNYGIAFICVVLVFAVMLMAYQKVLSIISCGIVGAFMLLMCMAIPLRSSLRLIFFNALYHQTEGGYVTVMVVAPVHAQDITLMVLWPVLIIAGAAFQFYRSKNQPHFHIPARRRRTVPVQVPHRFSGRDEENNDDETVDERTRLLPQEPHLNTRAADSYQPIQSSSSKLPSQDQDQNVLT